MIKRRIPAVRAVIIWCRRYSVVAFVHKVKALLLQLQLQVMRQVQNDIDIGDQHDDLLALAGYVSEADTHIACLLLVSPPYQCA